MIIGERIPKVIDGVPTNFHLISNNSKTQSLVFYFLLVI